MMLRLPLYFLFSITLLQLQVVLINATPDISSTIFGAKLNIPFLNKKKKYTPLLYFTAHKGELPTCDAMEKIVSEVEKELDLKIERLDVRQNRFYRKLYNIIDATNGSERSGTIPMLYHRESRQKICGLAEKENVRAWAKGMWLEELDMKEEKRGAAIDDEPSLEEMGLEEEEQGGFQLLD